MNPYPALTTVALMLAGCALFYWFGRVDGRKRGLNDAAKLAYDIGVRAVDNGQTGHEAARLIFHKLGELKFNGSVKP